MFRFAATLFFACLIFATQPSVAEAKRLALVIGNSSYTHASALPNPANDARDLAGAFTRLGYEVQLVEDATRAQFLDALRDFRARSLGADHSVIYYAGHGVEIDRQNYVIPVDAELKADIDVEYETVPLELLVAATSGARNLQLVVLDACRDNPFLTQMTRTLATRSVGRGLAVYEPDGNSLVAYAAREGTVALDGSGANSPYARAFLTALDQPGLEIGQFFRQVRDLVIDETNGQQEPFLYGSLSAEPVYFRSSGSSLRPAPRNPEPDAPSDGASTDTLLAIDLAFWQSIKDSRQASDFEDYLNRFPRGQFLPLAQRRLAALKAPETPERSAKPAAPQVVTLPKPATGPEAAPETRPAEDPAAKPLPLRLSRSDARDLQARLNILGFNAGVEDGLVGRKTLRAVAGYKAARGMPGEAQIDAALLARLRADVSQARLAAHRDAARKATPSTSKQAASTQPKPRANAPARKTAKPAAPAPKPAGNLSGFVGRSYCQSKGGKVINGRSLSDRPIWCITVLSLNSSQIRYRVTTREQYGKAVKTSVRTRSSTGTRRYGPVRLSSKGSGSISANGITFVASRIYK